MHTSRTPPAAAESSTHLEQHCLHSHVQTAPHAPVHSAKPALRRST